MKTKFNPCPCGSTPKIYPQESEGPFNPGFWWKMECRCGLSLEGRNFGRFKSFQVIRQEYRNARNKWNSYFPDRLAIKKNFDSTHSSF